MFSLEQFREDIDEKLNEEQLMKIIKKYRKLLEEYISPKTKKPYAVASKNQKISDMNTIIKEVHGEDMYKIIMPQNLPDKKEKQKQIEERHNKNIERLDDRSEFNYDELKNIVEALKTSGNLWLLTACAGICSGRRCTELIVRGTFRKSEKANHLWFNGQLKKKRPEDRVEYEIPIIFISVDEYLEIIELIRGLGHRYQAIKSNKKIASLTNQHVNKQIAILFGDNVTTETLRCVYAYIAYRLYGKDKVSEILYGARILGHSLWKLITFTINYNHAFVTDVPVLKQSKKKKLKKMLDEVEDEVEKL